MNFIILDYDIPEHRDFAGEMGIARHPAFAVVPPDSGPDEATDRKFGPLNEDSLRELLDAAVASYGQ